MRQENHTKLKRPKSRPGIPMQEDFSHLSFESVKSLMNDRKRVELILKDLKGTRYDDELYDILKKI